MTRPGSPGPAALSLLTPPSKPARRGRGPPHLFRAGAGSGPECMHGICPCVCVCTGTRMGPRTHALKNMRLLAAAIILLRSISLVCAITVK